MIPVCYTAKLASSCLVMKILHKYPGIRARPFSVPPSPQESYLPLRDLLVAWKRDNVSLLVYFCRFPRHPLLSMTDRLHQISSSYLPPLLGAHPLRPAFLPPCAIHPRAGPRIGLRLHMAPESALSRSFGGL